MSTQKSIICELKCQDTHYEPVIHHKLFQILSKDMK